MNKFKALLILIILATFSAKGQYFQTGQDPSAIKWRQINTENFQVIYPQEYENQAQKLAFVLEKVYDYGVQTLKFRPTKVSVVLHTYSANSNGLLAWAPKRIELFTTPNQEIYSQDWIEQLAVHEFRHLVQMDKIESSMPALLKILFGEQAAAAITGIYLPYWFLEGDAVVTETSLSKSGRGRTANFSMAYRAQLLEKGKYSFDKAYLGSYKDFVTDYYKLGYWMVGEARAKYGNEIWSEALNKIGGQPLSLAPLNSTLEKHTNKSAKQLYDNIFESLTSSWKKNLDSRKLDSIKIVSPVKYSYTEYLYPKFYQNTEIFAYRKSINDIGRFVLISPDKSERIIYTPGDIYDESVSLTGNLIIWAEKRADIRWTHAEHSLIQILNAQTGSKKEFNNENNLFAPVISPNLTCFAAVEVNKLNNYAIGIFDTKTGKQVDKIQTSDNQYFFTPSWDEKGEKIYAVSLSKEGKALVSIDIKSHKIEQLSDRTFANLKSPAERNGTLFFTSDFSGTDNIFSLNLQTREIKSAVNAPFGADFASTSNEHNNIIFSSYSANGYQIGEVKLESNTEKLQVKSIQLYTDSLADKLASQEIGVPDLKYDESTKYSSKKYSKLGHLFNFHSWAPLYVDLNSYEIRPGASLFSQNKLGTAETKLGYDYNTTSKTGRFKLNFTYLGWFPEISTEISAGKEASSYYLIKNTLNSNHQIIKSDTTIQRLSWQEFDADIDIRLPLNISRGKYSRIFYPEVKYSYINISKSDTSLSSLYPSGYNAMAYRVYFYNLLNQSSQNLMPRWGQQLDVVYRHSPIGKSNLGNVLGIQTALYFPGFLRNDGIKIYQGFQNKILGDNGYSFSNTIRVPRGFYDYQNNKMYSALIDYKLPLFYPDFSLGKLAYIKRIKSSIFYDYAWLSIPLRDNNGNIQPNSVTGEMKSLGVELTSDLHILRFFAPIELGIRATYRPDYKDYQVNLLLSVDFNGF